MSANTIVVQGVITPDGTLELEGKLPLSPGKVQVTVQPMGDVPAFEAFWQRMQKMWDAQDAGGPVAPSAEATLAEVRELREGWARRQEAIERLQEECRRRRAEEESSS